MSNAKSRERYDQLGMIDDDETNAENQFRKYIFQFGVQDAIYNLPSEENLNHGENIGMDVLVTLDEAMNGFVFFSFLLGGCEKILEGEQDVKCSSCDGTGSRDRDLIPCHYCEHGVVCFIFISHF